MSRIRIIGGQWRRRMIDVPEAPGLRPTPDRVRETLFNWLGQRMAGLSCLDLFAGTGALGLEAASRGAVHVTLVERDARLAASLRKTTATFGAQSTQVVCADALQFAAAEGRRYDVLFLDPPFAAGWLERVAPLIDRLMNADGLVYAEAEHPVERLGNWHAVKQGRAGQVYYQLLESVTA